MKKLLLVLLLSVPLSSMAWGLLGHRITGEIADSYLTPAARAQIKKILGNESIAMAGNYGDFIKSDPNYKDLDPWHYVDLDQNFTYPQMEAYLKADTSVNLYTKLNFLIAELKKKTLPADKKLHYLRLLIHFTEDVHQPFHVAHESDKGGNGFKVTWFGKETNIHTLWDSEFINFQYLSYTEYAKAINFTTAAERAALQKQDITRWVYDSRMLSEKLYNQVKPNDKLSYQYVFDNLATLNRQLLIGGVHLAGLLNSIFG